MEGFKMKNQIILLTIFILVLSCSTNTEPAETKSETYSLEDYYPLSIGNNWIQVAISRISDTLSFERYIIDTLRNTEGQIVYKTKAGSRNFPEGINYDYIYYYWDENGLWEGGCVDCFDQSTHTLSLSGKKLLLKTEVEPNEKWDNYQFKELQEQVTFIYNDEEYVYKDVAVIANLQNGSLLYFARNIGFIGNEEGWILVDYTIK